MSRPTTRTPSRATTTMTTKATTIAKATTTTKVMTTTTSFDAVNNRSRTDQEGLGASIQISGLTDSGRWLAGVSWGRRGAPDFAFETEPRIAHRLADDDRQPHAASRFPKSDLRADTGHAGLWALRHWTTAGDRLTWTPPGPLQRQPDRAQRSTGHGPSTAITASRGSCPRRASSGRRGRRGSRPCCCSATCRSPSRVPTPVRVDLRGP